jgi:hypothetical protein
MEVRKFLGRKYEIEQLRRLLEKNTASLVTLSGRRRIGKSRLIQEFSRGFTFYSFTGLPPSENTTPEDQRSYFATRMSQQFAMPKPNHKEWADLFWSLADRVKEGRVVILLDELSWMAQKDPLFLGKLKTAWDDHFKQNVELIMVLCSSVSIWMEENILADKGFMGRRSLHLHLTELPLVDCNEFWGNGHKAISAFEKFKFLAVTGGVPRYLEELKPGLSSEENIKSLCFERSGVLFREFEDIFTDIFTHETDRYRDIVMTLAQGSKSNKDICRVLKTGTNNVVSDYLRELEMAGFIKRDYTWNLSTEKTGKLSRYRLSDNYMRFYCKYIVPNRQQILNDEFIDASISSVIPWSGIMGLQFENLVLNNRKSIRKLLGIQAGETLLDGPYFQTKTTMQDSCQIDYLIQTKFNTLYVCEIKFSKNELTTKIIEECKARIARLKMPRHFSNRPVLIHVNGVQDAVIESGYFFKIIDFSDLLK